MLCHETLTLSTKLLKACAHFGNFAFGSTRIGSLLVLNRPQSIPGTIQLGLHVWRAEVVQVQQDGEDHLQK